MNAEAMAIRLSVLGRALPMRVLLVNDDPDEGALFAQRLENAGFEIARAATGCEALELLDRRWFPVLITNWRLPSMDGLALTHELRSRGVSDTYVIVLTKGESGDDYERGYLCGVDDYLLENLPEAELYARVHVAFSTLALRRSLQEAHSALDSSNPVDPVSGAINSQEALGKLHAELRRAQRYGRQLTVLTVGVDAAASAAAAKPDFLRRVVQIMYRVVRAHVDWVGRVETVSGAPAFMVVLPEAGPADGPTIKTRLNTALASLTGGDPAGSGFEFGLAALDRGGGEGGVVEAIDMLGVADQCRACPGRSGPAQLSTVQRSVATHLAIACRHGYVVDDDCVFKATPPGTVTNDR